MAVVNHVAFRKAKIIYNFGLSECKRVNPKSGIALLLLYYSEYYNTAVSCVLQSVMSVRVIYPAMGLEKIEKNYKRKKKVAKGVCSLGRG